ncbi:hypothetical protein BS78_09G221600 [Paspalum vaginatum]|nr:hypothetical protein BS78_09G221600 [Paspalum vaginatum]
MLCACALCNSAFADSPTAETTHSSALGLLFRHGEELISSKASSSSPRAPPPACSASADPSTRARRAPRCGFITRAARRRPRLAADDVTRAKRRRRRGRPYEAHARRADARREQAGRVAPPAPKPSHGPHPLHEHEGSSSQGGDGLASSSPGVSGGRQEQAPPAPQGNPPPHYRRPGPAADVARVFRDALARFLDWIAA